MMHRSTAWRHANPARASAHQAAYRASAGGKAVILARSKTDKAKAEVWRCYLRAEFGISPEQYNTLLEVQGGVCAICSEPPGKRRLAVDHDHVTGRLRGLLCFGCNTVLGRMHDDPTLLLLASEYLRRHQCLG